MAYEHALQRYRHWYTQLLRFYPRSYRERFGEEMEQIFTDLCRERIVGNRGLFGFVIWVFAETFMGIIRENVIAIVMQNNIIRVALITGLILSVPLLAMQFSEEVQWGLFDFIFMGALIFGTGLAFLVVAQKVGAISYKIGVGLGLLAMFLLIWINAAVGIIGDDNPSNLLYAGIIIIGLIGAWRAGLRPQGMANAMFVIAGAQLLIPVIALMVWGTSIFLPGVIEVFVLNAGFAALFMISGLFFRHAAQ